MIKDSIIPAILGRPTFARKLIGMMALPVGVAATFTGTTDGAITLGTALSFTFAKGFLYFPADSLVASHAAGFYYCEFSSTTAGVVYNNTYTPGVGANSYEPTTKVPFSGAVPGGAGSTSEITGYTIPATGLLSNYEAIQTSILVSSTSSANSKSVRVRLNSAQSGLVTLTNSPYVNGVHHIKAIGNASQRSTTFAATSSGTAYSTTEDMTAAATYSLTLQKATATENIVCEMCNMEWLT